MKKAIALFIIILTSLSCRPLRVEDIEDVRNLPDGLIAFAESFQNLYDSCDEKETFVFFSDPHLMGDRSNFKVLEQRKFEASFESMRKLYEFLPMEFCLSGGDWLKNKDTQEAAKEKLLYADARMKQWFSPYHKVMGNHDTNYQGIVSASDSSRGDLPFDFINNVYYKEEGKAYYSFMGKNTLFVILDSGIDWEVSLDEYRKNQLEWLVNQLQLQDAQHIVIGMHMFYDGRVENNKLMPMSREVLNICSAFNRKEVYESSAVKCDFSRCEGSIHLLICGHNHVDFEYYDAEVPCVGITQFISNGDPSFDLCLIDYDNGFFETVRVGKGQSRHIPIAQ